VNSSENHQPEPAPPAAGTPQAKPEPEPASTPERKYEVGQRIWGKVLRLSDTQATIGLGEHELDEGTLDLIHLRDDFGNLSISEGDSLQAYVVKVEPGIQLAPSLTPPAAEVMKKLKEAKEKDEVIRARVTGINRGGLDVVFEGRRAFCPFSQIEIGRCENPEIYLNHILEFKVSELDEEKRRIVLSRRAVLDIERKEKLQELRAQIKEGAEFEGVVMRIQPFGAFVDIGGIDGLVHVSEISFDRIDHPGQLLKRGEKVRVKVLGVTRGDDGKERIRLSMKALLADPWTTIGQTFHEGDIVTGKVMRVAEFGTFVKLQAGIEGLLHVSQYRQSTATTDDDSAEAAEAVADAEPSKLSPAVVEVSDVPVVGQEITVRISRIDANRRRISLALRDEERGGRGKADHDASVGDRVEGVVRTVKPYGVFLDLPSLGPWVSGLLPGAETGLGREANLRRKFPIGEKFEVDIIDIDDQGRIRLSRRSLVEGGDAAGGGAAGTGQSLPTAPPGGFNVLADALRRAQEKGKGQTEK